MWLGLAGLADHQFRLEDDLAMLLRAGRLGGFDFNSRFYADDDLMVGAADPFQLFRIMHEVIRAGALTPTRWLRPSRPATCWAPTPP